VVCSATKKRRVPASYRIKSTISVNQAINRSKREIRIESMHSYFGYLLLTTTQNKASRLRSVASTLHPNSNTKAFLARPDQHQPQPQASLYLPKTLGKSVRAS
jgi:hypothetical protein